MADADTPQMTSVTQASQGLAGRRHLIACEVFRDEFEAVSPPDLIRSYLPQGLHRTPGKMPAAIQEILDGVPAVLGSILLGYGLCSNGVVGVASRTAPLIMPRVHDCIALLLGSRERYEAEVAACPGTYYITPGWALYGTTSLTCYKNEYLPKYGEETARYIATELLKNYRRVALIDHGIGDMDAARAHAREMAEVFNLSYAEIPGSVDYVRRLVHGPWDSDDFVLVQPGTRINSSPFLSLHSIALA
ncbi:MAG: DUF1638 domain-containing protein [candidate division NC10 bacterium]|nr:DUF1638 domain-containing protein [candidate division NC10 bacterium]MBI4841685.1 DUF1638 domain-containing protein [candidate division NC10 bacterium]